MHGVGQKYTPRALYAFGFPVDSIVFVDSQKDPDPDFPTAPKPNPEEGEPVLVCYLLTTAVNSDQTQIKAPHYSLPIMLKNLPKAHAFAERVNANSRKAPVPDNSCQRP